MVAGPSDAGARPGPALRSINGAASPRRLTSGYLARTLGWLLEPFGYRCSAGVRLADLPEPSRQRAFPKITVEKQGWRGVLIAETHILILAAAPRQEYYEFKPLDELTERLGDIFQQRYDDHGFYRNFWYLESEAELRPLLEKSVAGMLGRPIP